MSEYFDVVDDGDIRSGCASRIEVHSKGLIHRSVLFFIFDSQHRVFVNRRTFNKDFYPGYWSIVFGGHVHAGESYENAVIREVKEEAGIDAKPIFITKFQKRFDALDKENVHVFAFIAKSGLTLDPDEIMQGEFMTIDELEEKTKVEKFLPETQTLLPILKDYLRKNEH